MLRTVLFFIAAGFAAAQVIPNRYIVELKTDPTAAVSAAKKTRYSAADADVTARRAQIQAEHQAAEAAVVGLGGTVTHHFDTALNAMAVTMTAQAAQALSQNPMIRQVYPVNRHKKLLDQAVNVHRAIQAWQTLGGSSNAGAGIKIGILDCGIDVNHPGFQNFSTAVPTGFPIISGGALTTEVNNKVIVARVYSDLMGGVDNTATTATDICVHGTSVAMVAGGLTNDPGITGISSPITGFAPGAWLGNYKVLDDTGAGDDVTFLAALNDAMNDGMNVLNYSVGGPIFSSSDETGADARAIANAQAAGVLVVVAAGNGGPSAGTVSSPGVTPAAIAVGATENQRLFWYAAKIGTLGSFISAPAQEEIGVQTGDVTGPGVDVSTIDGNGYACNALPGNSLTGAIAIIQRGGPNGGPACSFQSKLNNAAQAGAVGAVIYDNNTTDVIYDFTVSGVNTGYGFGTFDWSMGTATLPVMMISQADGQNLLQLVTGNSGTTMDLDFDAKTALPAPANVVTDFSGIGPTPAANIKPDITAVGDWLVTALTTYYEDPSCTPPFTDLVCYPPYTILDGPNVYGFYLDDGSGTSFATPMVTGAVAALMAARPGLTGPQYRSLVVNSAPEFDQYSGNIAPPQTAGAGMLDLLGALQAGLAASPTSLNFSVPANTGGGGAVSSSLLHTSSFRPGSKTPKDDDSTPAPSASQTLTITNLGANSDTFTVTVTSLDGISPATVSPSSFSIANGASQDVTVSIPGVGLAAGQYHGFVVITGTQGQTPLRVPYWFAVAGAAPNSLTITCFEDGGCEDAADGIIFFGSTGDAATIYFRLLDVAGLPIDPSGTPTVTTSNSRAKVTGVAAYGDIPGTFAAQITLGRADPNGLNTFTINAPGINPVSVIIVMQ